MSPDEERAWHVSHPADRWFKYARPRVHDAVLGSLVDEWIADLSSAYDELLANDWSTVEDRAPFLLDVLFDDNFALASSDPLKANVMTVSCAAAPLHETVLVDRAPKQENIDGLLLSPLPRERWRLCAELQPDGTLLPLDGTQRMPPA
jgi:hypothetical protein